MKSKPVSDEEIRTILEAYDSFTVAIRGHQALEELLNVAISEALADPHALEIKRLGFALKVDLAAAVGVVGDRSVLVCINRIRNRFAHNRHARLTQRDVDAVIAGASAETRAKVAALNANVGGDLDTLTAYARLIVTIFVRLQAQITAMRDEKAHLRASVEVAQEILSPNRWPLKEREREGKVIDRVNAAVEKEKRERQARGEL
jgi:hypothetical protein